MTLNPEYSTVLKRISAWPVEDRIALAQEVLGALKSAGEQRHGPKDTASRALGLAKGSGAAPSDEEVRRWIEEHRMEKYGR